MTDDAVLEKPVIVLGSPRSGTTVLGQLLQVHSSLHGVVEPRLTWQYGNDKKSDMLRPEDARPEVIAYIRGRFAKEVRDGQRSRLLEKMPSNALRIGFVERVLPGCKVIHIMRNGVDASLSIRSYWNQAAHGISGVAPGRFRERLKELQLSRLPNYAFEAARRFAPAPLRGVVGQNVWGPRIPGIRGMLTELDLLEVCALQWRTCVESARQYGAQLPADRYHEVKLEELTADRLREVLDFAELTPEPEVMANFEKTFAADRSTARRSAATPEDLQLLRRWITPTMDWLGYPRSHLE
ncbi:MAG: sulfotransferase [Planctomycetota bacterium]